MVLAPGQRTWMAGASPAPATARTRALLRGYFAQGGLQLQVNVIDQRTLEAAVREPDKYGDLVIRMGGYSEFWSRLTPQLRQSVLLRTEPIDLPHSEPAPWPAKTITPSFNCSRS